MAKARKRGTPSKPPTGTRSASPITIKDAAAGLAETLTTSRKDIALQMASIGLAEHIRQSARLLESFRVSHDACKQESDRLMKEALACKSTDDFANREDVKARLERKVVRFALCMAVLLS